jgi:hypothetical protein
MWCWPWLANLPSRPRGGVVGSCWVGQASTDIRVYALGGAGRERAETQKSEAERSAILVWRASLYIGGLAVECNRGFSIASTLKQKTANTPFALFISFLGSVLSAFPFSPKEFPGLRYCCRSRNSRLSGQIRCTPLFLHTDRERPELFSSRPPPIYFEVQDPISIRGYI